MKKPMHKIEITIDPDNCGPAIWEGMLMSVMPLPEGVAWKEFTLRQKKLKSALKKAVGKIEDCGPVKKRRKA